MFSMWKKVVLKLSVDFFLHVVENLKYWSQNKIRSMCTLYSTFKRSFSVGTYVFSAFYFAIFWYQLENRPTLLPIYELDNYIQCIYSVTITKVAQRHNIYSVTVTKVAQQRKPNLCPTLFSVSSYIWCQLICIVTKLSL